MRTCWMVISIVLVTIAGVMTLEAAVPDKAVEKAFLNRMHQEYNFDEQELQALFTKVKFNPRIIDTMERPYESKPWYIYKKSFLSKQRIQKGVAFWRAHDAELRTVEKQYGVPPQIIVAILGVETFYGQRAGHHRVIDALSTLAFGYPKRARFFQNELAQYLVMCRDMQLDPLSLTGSYAGAMGWPQFMPSSYRHYAISYTGNGSPDIWQSPNDVMASIGHYLKKNRWRAGQPVASPATWDGADEADIPFNKGRRPRHTAAYWLDQGVQTHPVLSLNATPLRLEGEEHPEYWLGYENFSAIMSYNPRVHYAMAVYQLSEAIRRAHASQS